ncbi:MAG TPA: hypothetical protein VK576_08865 [Thermoleophilia bacterium]|nr:hypothetical protein [Thermoleophilia bacterium]
MVLLALSQGVAEASVDVDLYTSGRFTTKKPEPAFLRRSNDDPGHISYAIGALKIHPPQRLPVYLVGDSLMRECVTTEDGMAATLKTASGVETSLYVLASSSQNFGESMAIVDNLPPGPGLIVLSVGHAQFAYPLSTLSAQIQGDRLLMPSTTLWRFVLKTAGKAPRNSIAPGIAAYLAAWRRVNAQVLAAGGRPWHPYLLHRQSNVLSNANKRWRIGRWLDGRGRPGGMFDTWNDFSGSLLERLVRRAQTRGLTVVLMESSENRGMIGSAWDRTTDSYQTTCRRVAGDCGIAYIDPNLTAGLENLDFRDLLHLAPAGRPKWMNALAPLLAPTVQSIAATASTAPAPSSARSAAPPSTPSAPPPSTPAP